MYILIWTVVVLLVLVWLTYFNSWFRKRYFNKHTFCNKCGGVIPADQCGKFFFGREETGTKEVCKSCYKFTGYHRDGITVLVNNEDVPYVFCSDLTDGSLIRKIYRGGDYVVNGEDGWNTIKFKEAWSYSEIMAMDRQSRFGIRVRGFIEEDKSFRIISFLDEVPAK